MEFFSHPIVAVVLLLGILVIVHESGHFIVGKLCGIPVEIFSIGFGPTLIGFRRGETHYRISAIPLGGFVKFYGSLPSEEVPDSVKGREFFRASIPARIATIAAGPLFNLGLTVLVFTGMVMYGIQQPPATVGEIVKGSPADRAGLLFFDRIVAIDGHEVRSWKDVQRLIGERPEQNLNISLKRQDQEVTVAVAPESVKDEDLPGQRGRIGISRFMIPAVVARVSDEGFLSKAGLKTGDRLVKVEWQGQSIEVRYWQQFIDFLQKLSLAQQQGQAEAHFKLEVRDFEPSESEVGAASASATRQLEVLVPADWTFQAEQLASTTGITHAQLTVFKTEEPLQGLVRGDIIVSWEGQKLDGAFDLSQRLSSNKKSEVTLSIVRDEKPMDVSIQLKPLEVQKAEGKATIYTLPILFWGNLEQPDWIEERFTNPFKALAFGLAETADLTRSIGKAIGGLFTGEMPLTTLGGPIAIAKVASESARMGWQAFMHALALISINLALLNLIPIPVLDGGQLVLVSTEAALRRPVSEVAIENYQKIGFVMVLALFVIATYNDLGRFWASMLRGVSTMF